MHLFLWCKNLWSKKYFTDEPGYHTSVETMDEESENYRPTEFLKTRQNFFKDFCFKFEGLSDECEKGFTHIIKDLGGEVSKNARYTLVEKSYFEKDENKKRKDLYHLHFILDCLDCKKLLDIELYRCNKTFNENAENSPSILQRRSINFHNDNINIISERNNFSNDTYSNDDMHIREVITPTKSHRAETLKKNISNAKERNLCDNITTVRNNSSNESNSDDDIQMSEAIAASKSQDRDEILKKTVSNVKKKSYANNVSVSGINGKATIRNNFSNEANSDDDIQTPEVIAPSKSQSRVETLKKTESKKKNPWSDNIYDSGDKVSVRNNFSNESNSDDNIPISEMITPRKSQDRHEILKKSVSNVKKRKPFNNDNTTNGNTTIRDNVSNEINSDHDIPIIERIKQSKSQQDEILKKNNSNAKKRKLGNPIRSDTESSSSDESVKIKMEASSSDSSDEIRKVKPEPKSSDSSDEIIEVKPEPKSSDSSDDSYLTSNKKSKNKRVNVKSEISSSSDESTNYESESEPSKRKRRKKESDTRGQTNSHKSVSQNKTNSKVTKVTKRAWVDTKDLENNRNKNKKDNNTEEHLSSSSSVEWSKSKIEDRPDLKWLFEVDKNNLCELKNCTFAPGFHESHCYAGRIISDEEKKIILQYLIKNNVIPRAKGIRTWERMISEGYLSHRSADTLRNCLRRVILPGICRFKLPIDIMDQFLSLDEKKAKGKKIW